jgi:hypothetical protein
MTLVMAHRLLSRRADVSRMAMPQPSFYPTLDAECCRTLGVADLAWAAIATEPHRPGPVFYG